MLNIFMQSAKTVRGKHFALWRFLICNKQNKLNAICGQHKNKPKPISPPVIFGGVAGFKPGLAGLSACIIHKIRT